MSKSLHSQILAMKCPASQSQFSTRHELNCFMDGHQAARHSAASLAIVYDDAKAGELNAARALLREVSNDGALDMGDTNTAALGARVRSYLDACDKPGEQNAS